MDLNKYCQILIVCSIVLIFQLPQVIAQSYTTKNKKAIRFYQEAQGLIGQRRFEPAISSLSAAIAKDSNFTEAHLSLAGIQKLLLNGPEAKKHYLKAVESRPDAREMAGAYLTAGEYLYADGQYEKALTYFKKVQGYKMPQKNQSELVDRYVANSEYALKALKNPLKLTPPKLMASPINQFYLQAFPVVTADGRYLIFQERNGTSPKDDEEIVVSENIDGHWSEPKPLSPNINSPNNEGACTISGDGRTLVFASCSRPGTNFNSCDLYISYKEGSDWSVPENMGLNVNSPFWESEPSISADGKTVYFTSDRMGGYGKEDLWVTHRNDKNEWTPCANLGKSINTKGREVSPFIHANGKSLFFSSDAYPGMGGFDIYYVVVNDTILTSPKNVGYPLNKNTNDISLFITADGSKGYYSEDKREKPGLSYTRAFLYEFDVPDELKDVVKRNTYAKGKVYDAVTKLPLGATIELIDLKTSKPLQLVNSDKKTGEYIIVLTEGAEYGLYVNSTGYLFKSSSFDFRNADLLSPTQLDIYLDPLKKGAGVVLNNIFFNVNSYDLDPKSRTELNKIAAFLMQYPAIAIEFGGHTDNVGQTLQNMTLSNNRAKSVFDFLIAAGIPKARLKYKGYGETIPVAGNTTSEGRQLNRRIEFKIL